jgi:uncharacterized cupin superfamily protein
MTKRIDPTPLAPVIGTLYPPPFDAPCRARGRIKLADAAGFRARDPNGHCLQNRSDRDAQILEIDTRVADDAVYYPDIDMVASPGSKPAVYTRRDGTPYSDIRRRGP